MRSVAGKVQAIIENELTGIERLIEDLTVGRYRVY